MAKLYGEIAAKALLTLDKSFARANGQPLDASEVYYSLEDAKTYAAGAQAYIGQKIVVIENGVVTHYGIEDAVGTLKELGSKPVGDGTTISIAQDGTISLANISDAEATGTYNAVLVNGKLTWVKPSETTVEGLSDLISALTSRVSTIEGDYLQDEDKTQLIDAIEEAIAAEKERAESVEESLQTQINTIMNNPDTEGVINSINEFTEYIEEHGSIADGLRSDIDTNTDEIEDLKSRIDAVESFDHSKYATNDSVNTIKTNLETAIAGKGSATDVAANAEAIEALQGEDLIIKGRLDTLEAIDHNAYASKEDLKATDDKALANAGNITALGGRIDNVETIANTGVTNAATAQAKAEEAVDAANANAQAIVGINSTLEEYLGKINKNATDIGALSTAVATNEGQIASLITTVSKKADTTTVEALAERIGSAEGTIVGHTADIATLNGLIANKANSADVYTKNEIGTIAEGETIISMITKAKEDATYDDTAIRALIDAEAKRADEAEKLNAAEIARVNEVLVKALDNNADGLDSIKELATWINGHGATVDGLIAGINDNAKAIETLSNGIPNAIESAMVKADGTTIENIDGTFSVKSVSTDMLTQGEMTLVLNGGSAATN